MTTQPKSEIVLNLAEEFVGRYRRGERPAVSEYIEKFPELAEEIREVLPAMAMLENIAPENASLAARPLAPATAAAAPFDQLGDFRIIREVGRGGMGVVYEAEQLSLGRHVALKLLPREARADSRFKQRFEREARAAARLHHTNIVPVFGVGEHEGMPYYVMQFIQGLGLDEVLRELQRLRDAGISPTAGDPKGELRRPRRELSPTECARSMIEGRGDLTAVQGDPNLAAVSGSTKVNEMIAWAGERGKSRVESGPAADDCTIIVGGLSDTTAASDVAAVLPGHSQALSGGRRRIPAYWRSIGHIGIQVADALQHAHEQGILHRDVKPSNLLLDTRGTVWVTDFGLAKTNDQQDLTQSGDVLGTLRYMSPEAFNGKADARSDVYSLGATLYELAALRPAYDENDRPRLIKQITTTEPPRLDKLSSDVPRDLATVIHKAIDRDPDHRYRTAAELAADLQRFLDDEPIRARRPSLPERMWRWARRNRELAAALSVISLLLVVGTVAASIAATRFHGDASKMASLAALSEIDRRQAVAARDDALVARRNEQELRERESELRRQAEAAQSLANERAETVRQNLYFAQMSIVRQGWKEMNGARRAQDLLVKWRPGSVAGPDAPRDLRGWEWYYLASHYSRSRLTLREQWGPVEMGSYSPDGRRFALATHFRGVEIRDAETGRLLVSLDSQQLPLRAVDWNPDGTIVATAGDEKEVRLWDAATGRRIAALPGHEAAILALEFSPDGKRLVSASRDQTLRIWDAVEYRETAVLRGHEKEVQTARWNPAGTRIASASSDGTIRVWDAQTNGEILKWKDLLWRGRVCWSPDGRHIAATSSDELACKLWDAETGREVRRFRGHAGEVCAVVFDRTGRRLASSGIDGVARIWDVEAGQALAAFRGHVSTATCVDWSPDGERLLSTGQDGVVRVWEVGSNQEFTALSGHTAYPKCLAWSPDGRKIVSGGIDATLRVWDIATTRETAAIPSGGEEIRAVSWSPNRPWIATGNEDGTVRIWDESAGRLLATLAGHNNPVVAVQWSPDGGRLASGSHDGSVKIWDPGTLAGSEDAERLLYTLRGHGGGVSGVSFSPDGKWLASSSYDGSIKLWDAANWREAATLKANQSVVHGVCWSPDSTRIASCAWDDTARIWDVASRRETATLTGHAAILYTIAWSPDGTRIASGGMDRQIRLWDAATGTEVISFDTHANQVIGLAWSPDGLQLASASFDRTLQIFDAVPASEREGTSGLLVALERRLAACPDSARGYALRARALARLGRVDEARNESERAVQAYERLLVEHPDNDRDAGEYARFLLDRALARVEWTAVKPAEMRASGDTTLISGPDKSILAGGTVSNGAVYEVAIPVPESPVTALRLEALPDPSFPNHGSGRDVNGNFVLTHVAVRPGATTDVDAPAKVKLRSAWTDFVQQEFRVGRAIEQPQRHDWGWAVYPAMRRSHEAVFEFDKPVELGAGARLTVQLACQHPAYQASVLGHFRLSLTSAPDPARFLRLRDDLARSSARGWPRLAAVAALTGDRRTAALAREKSAALADGTLTGEELFLLGMAAAWLEQAGMAEAYLQRGLDWRARHPLDVTLNELARDALAAIRHLGDTSAGELLAQP